MLESNAWQKVIELDTVTYSQQTHSCLAKSNTLDILYPTQKTKSNALQKAIKLDTIAYSYDKNSSFQKTTKLDNVAYSYDKK